MRNRVLTDGCTSMHTHKQQYSSTTYTPLRRDDTGAASDDASTLHNARGKQSLLHERLAQKGLTARERSLAKGERSHTIHLAGVRGSPPACSMSLGSTHSTAVKGRSSTLTRTGRVAPPICTTITITITTIIIININSSINEFLASRHQVRATQVS